MLTVLKVDRLLFQVFKMGSFLPPT